MLSQNICAQFIKFQINIGCDAGCTMEECPNTKCLTRFIAHQYQAGKKDHAQLSQLVFN